MRFRRSPNLIEEITDDTVFVRLADGTDWIVLDNTALLIWKSCKGTFTTDDLVASLTEQFTADEDVISADVEVFMNRLVNLGILQTVRDD